MFYYAVVSNLPKDFRKVKEIFTAGNQIFDDFEDETFLGIPEYNQDIIGSDYLGNLVGTHQLPAGGWPDYLNSFSASGVTIPPLVVSHYVGNRRYNVGDTVELGASLLFPDPSVDPDTDISLSWELNGSPVGSNSYSLVIENAQVSDSGIYILTVTVGGPVPATVPALKFLVEVA